MPVIVGREQSGRSSFRRVSSGSLATRTIRLGLVNNMPDAALARTARQFLDVLEAAAPDLLLRLDFFSLNGIPRGELGERHCTTNLYRDACALGEAELDGLIVTGTEPRQADLRREPYWGAMTRLFDWIDRAGPPAIFSCLAAHAAVLHFDGIERRRLERKCFGLLDHIAVCPHELTNSLGPVWKVSHSRWNEVGAEALQSSGYTILTQTDGAGPDLFVKHRRNLLLFFQGHPEYDFQTLGREYQRDVKRFLAGEHDTYPHVPENYFDPAEAKLLSHFQARALVAPSAALMPSFPVSTARIANSNEPNAAAVGMYRAWLLGLLETKDEAQAWVPGAATARVAGTHRS